MYHKAFWFFRSVFVLSAMLALSLGYVQAQITGFIPVFVDEFGSEDASVIFQDSGTGNIGIGTTTPTAKLHVAGGNVNLDDSTATSGNILKGGVPFIHNFGTNNTFLGQNAGNLTMTGGGNTAIGHQAFQNNTIGSGNTAIGARALEMNRGFRPSMGSGNTAIGARALQNNTIGSSNTAIGSSALADNTIGRLNTAIGAGALRSNTTGGGNTASGDGALFFNTTGSGNTASGHSALADNTTGSRNTASGDFALHQNTTGERNTAMGDNALDFNTTGDNNTAIGARANVSAVNLINATAIGAGAIVDDSNKIRLGNTAVTVIEGEVPYTFSSDKTKKENFQPVDGEEVLRKIRGLSLTSWNYIGHDPQEFRHYGPVAQEFFAAFGHDGLGTIGTPTTINSGDMAGILMIAIQALEKRTAENAALKARIEVLERAMGSYALTKAE